MTNLLKKLGGALAGVAPALATAVGGPVGGVIASAAIAKIGEAAGLPAAEATPERCLAAMQSGAVDLAALRRADGEFDARMRELDVDLERIAADDRAGARRMRTRLGGDATSSWLAWITVLAFFASLGGMVWVMTLPGEQETALVAFLGTALGYTGGMASQVISFFFGSSTGEQRAREES